MNPADYDLIQAAKNVRERAYAPYSQYKVGAAVLTESGEIITGCNVENSCYPLSTCAEKTALCRAVAQGHQKFKKIVLVTHNCGTPCGSCRQVIWELCGDIPILIVGEDDQVKSYTSGDLLPDPFKLETN